LGFLGRSLGSRLAGRLVRVYVQWHERARQAA
jgi:hypothetical protein